MNTITKISAVFMIVALCGLIGLSPVESADAPKKVVSILAKKLKLYRLDGKPATDAIRRDYPETHDLVITKVHPKGILQIVYEGKPYLINPVHVQTDVDSRTEGHL